MAEARVEPFRVDIPQDRLDDLAQRLQATRLPPDLGCADWTLGASRPYLESFVASWRDFDWRATETEINAYPNYVADLGGVRIHFMWSRGRGEHNLPLLLTHGWPWTFWDYREAVDILTDPDRIGHPSGIAFDVVIPSLPGFGFSTPLSRTGVGTAATAELWAELMDVLGYEQYGVAGGDFGVPVSAILAHNHPERVLGLHAIMPPVLGTSRDPQAGDDELATILRRLNGQTAVTARQDFAPDERRRWDQMRERWPKVLSHLAVHMTDPQSIAFGMHDSPVGLAAWILERRHNYSDHGGDIEDAFSRQFLLELVSLYWFSDSFASSALYYWSSLRKPWSPRSTGRAIQVPVGMAVFEKELVYLPRAELERDLDLVHWSEFDHGGHFAPSEVPDTWSQDVATFFANLAGSTVTRQASSGSGEHPNPHDNRSSHGP